MTTDAQQMVWWLGNLTATGGGDEPELYFSGMILALENVRPGSSCYSFTDAAAKDAELQDEAEALALANHVEVIILVS